MHHLIYKFIFFINNSQLLFGNDKKIDIILLKLSRPQNTYCKLRHEYIIWEDDTITSAVLYMFT